MSVNREITRRINEITGYDLTDSFCGFKAYRVDAVKKLELTEPNYGMPLQLWMQAWKHGLTVKEIPIGLIYFDHSRQFPGDLKRREARLRYYHDVIERELADG
jgi:dolichol-phosphate mannosyltransferase